MEIAIDDMIWSLDFESDWNRWSNLDGLESELSTIQFGDPNCLSLMIWIPPNWSDLFVHKLKSAVDSFTLLDAFNHPKT